MPERRIAMQTRAVTFTLAGGRTLTGEVFLGLYEAHRDGPQRLGDLLNGNVRFLPVRTAEGVVLVHARHIVSARIEHREERDELMRLGSKHRIRVTTVDDEEIVADIFINLPHTHQRVKDCLNHAERFLPLFVGEDILYFSVDHILWVTD